MSNSQSNGFLPPKKRRKKGVFTHQVFIDLIDTEINAKEALFLSLIRNYLEKGLKCFISNKKIGEFLKINEQSVKNMLNKLKGRKIKQKDETFKKGKKFIKTIHGKPRRLILEGIDSPQEEDDLDLENNDEYYE